MSDIDTRFLDYSFPASPKYTRGYLGMGDTGGFRAYQSQLDLIPDSDWESTAKMIEDSRSGLSWMISRIKDQGQEGSCFVAGTELLTSKGWIDWSDYDYITPAATVSATGALEYQTPTQRHVYDYSGQVIYSTSESVDFGVTPDHRMLVRPFDAATGSLSASYSMVDAGKLGWYSGLMAAPTGWVGTEYASIKLPRLGVISGDDFVKLLAIMCADGFASSDDRACRRVSFCCFSESRQAGVRELALRLGFREQPSRPGVWYLSGVQVDDLRRYLIETIYSNSELGAKNKIVPGVIRFASARQIALFLEWFGDRSHTRSPGMQYFTSSKLMADGLQELCLKIGHRASVAFKNANETPRLINGREIKGCSSYVITEWSNDKLSIDRKRQIEIESYNGPVFCATVPNGTLITRRNGTVLIAGNCVGNGSTYAFEATYRQQFGVSVPFSAMSLYKQIGRSAQSGAVVTDGIESMAQVGILPEDTPNNRALFPMTFPATGFGNKLPPGFELEAKKFRATEWLLINSKAALVSALLSGRPVVVGREGHCICYTDILFRKGKMLARYVNSWGIDWGDAAGSMRGGFGYDSERLINEASQGAFALMAITVPT